MTGPEEIADARRSFLVAPAGCGKTELIARAITCRPERRELVLTHTHAGVGALRSRLMRFGASPRQFRVDTIAGFALRVAAGYPSTSGLRYFQPTGKEWSGVYEAAQRVIGTAFGHEVIRASYDGLYVDEYQDCTIDQHRLVLSLGEVLPCRLLGDPLQGIFGFAGTLVSWDGDIRSSFEELQPLDRPWRWATKNPELGEWLLTVRAPLMEGRPLDLSGAPVVVGASTPAKQVLACHRAGAAGGSVVGIRKWPRDAHEVARRLGGAFTSMEEMDCADLMRFCRKLQSASGLDRAVVVLDFAAECMTEVSSVTRNVRSNMAAGRLPRVVTGARTEASVRALGEVAAADAPMRVVDALDALRSIRGVKVFRRELLAEMHKAAAATADGSFDSLVDAAWAIRDRARHAPRRLEPRLISRTLLVKGLEFDRCVVLDANELDARNLYVALTRGSKELAVLTREGGDVVRYSGAD